MLLIIQFIFFQPLLRARRIGQIKFQVNFGAFAVRANIAGIGTLGAPVVGVLSSWILLGEDLSAAEIVGMVLVVLALGLLVVRGHRTTGQSGTDDANHVVLEEEPTGT